MASGVKSSPAKYRALIVDNDVGIRDLASQALADQGFVCDHAAHAAQAQQLAQKTSYDVVLTDLRMPLQDGCLLALELLLLSPRPIVIVFTGVTDPRLTKELLICGVDDVIFKPIRFSILAAKILALVEKSGRVPCAVDAEATAANDESPAVAPDAPRALLDPRDIVPSEEYERRLYSILELPPVSPVLLDVFRMAKSESGNAEQLAANIARDAFLAAEVLRMANSSFYNPSGKQISELRLAVARLGRRTIAALALARHMLEKTWNGWSHLVNAQLAWRQSVGAGVAVEMIMEQRQQSMGDELFLCALMHSMGRLIMLSLFPATYEVLAERCRDNRLPMIVEERRVFPENHSATMMRLLRHWGISPAVYAPLEFTSNDYDYVRGLKEPMRSQVELVKVAALIGRIAAGPWESWEQVDFPPEDVLIRLGLKHDALQSIIQTTSSDTEKLCTLGATGAPGDHAVPLLSQLKQENSAPYVYLGSGFDWLAHLLPACGLLPRPLVAAKPPQKPAPAIVNCLGLSDVASHVDRRVSGQHHMLILEAGPRIKLATDNQIIRLPCSFAELRRELSRVAVPAAAELSAEAGVPPLASHDDSWTAWNGQGVEPAR